MTNFTISDNGGEIPKSYNVTISAQVAAVSNSHTSNLQKAPLKGGSGVYDLSNKTGGTGIDNSANCYVVDAPGNYCLPLVYGNAMKDKQPNPSAYTSSVIGSNILQKFINHKGKEITSPYIYQQEGITIDRVDLLWQDAPGLITDIHLSANKTYLHFSIKKETIQQGNAVLAVYDTNNEIAWSWHIWVTDEKINETIEVTNNQGNKYKFMPVNLGWCDGDTHDYAQRSCQVKFIAGNATQTILLKQAAESINSGNHPYYQWGRKDPFLPSDGLKDENKTWYNNSGTSSTESPGSEDLGTGVACLRNYILKPNVMQEKPYGDSFYQNLWNAGNNVYEANDNKVVKTIYDPSPVGFTVPRGNAFTGFITPDYEFNGTWENSLKGVNFYTDSEKNKTIFFPASGFRDYNGRQSFVGSQGNYWLATPSSPSLGRYLLMYSNYAGLDAGNDRAYGFGVRPSQE